MKPPRRKRSEGFGGPLTLRQHRRLDKLELDHPGAEIVGWHPRGGPIIYTGPHTYHYIDRRGQLIRFGGGGLAA